jgi:hypothetical protein
MAKTRGEMTGTGPVNCTETSAFAAVDEVEKPRPRRTS